MGAPAVTPLDFGLARNWGYHSQAIIRLHVQEDFKQVGTGPASESCSPAQNHERGCVLCTAASSLTNKTCPCGDGLMASETVYDE
jgi:hypothetical protein